MMADQSRAVGPRMLILAALTFSLAGGAAGRQAIAGPLAVEQCAALNTQVTALEQAGIKDLVEKGPAVAKADLGKAQREQVRSYLDALGQLRFRCPSETPFVVLKPVPPDDPAEAASASAPIEAGAAGITLPAGVAAAVVGPIVPKKPAVPKTPKAAAAVGKAQPKRPAKAAADSVTAPSTVGKAAAGAAAPPAKAKTSDTPKGGDKPTAAVVPPAPAKAKAKAKADDAYRPPAGTPATVGAGAAVAPQSK